MPQQDHIHKYIRVKNKNKGSKNQVFKCAIDKCPHYLYEGIIIGREALCWRCRKSFTITKRSLRNKFLHCLDCTKNKITKIDNVDLLIAEITKDSMSRTFENVDELK